MRNDERFNAGIAHLRAYVNEHGHGRVPRTFVTAEGFRLGRWVAVKRLAIRNNSPAMTEQRIAALNASGFVLHPRRGVQGPTALHHEQWNDGITHLRTYIAEHGDADVPRRYVSPDGYQLGMWVQTRRKQAHTGRLTDSARIEELNKLGFVWTSQRRGGFGITTPPSQKRTETQDGTAGKVDGTTDTDPKESSR